MSRVAVLQSNYLPWRGYFDIIDEVEVFVFYDDVQYTKNDWRNRNRIKTSQGTQWLSVPCGRRLDRLICEVEPTDCRWQRRHWQTIRQSYSRAPNFSHVRDLLEDFYCARQWRLLSELNIHFIKTVSRVLLGIDTAFLDSRDFDLIGSRQERLLMLLRRVGATSYLSGPSARSYLDTERFRDRGIDVIWKSYAGYPEYPQLHPPFEPRVSIIDLLANVGEDARRYIKAEERSGCSSS